MGILYGSCDLHSNNSYAVISDEEDEVIKEKRLPNDLEAVDQFFKGYKNQLSDIAVESTYNGYWLIDGLQELGYGVKLANPSQMKPYSGLKHSDDDTDARWLNQMNRLGILPEGYIYPKQTRPIRDSLRRRLLFVKLRTSLINSFKHQYQSWEAIHVKRSAIEKLSTTDVEKTFKDPYLQQSGRAMLEIIQKFSREVEAIETAVQTECLDDVLVKRLQSLPGIGKVLSLTIRFELGSLERFKNTKHYLSYCGLVESKRMSNGKVKGKGNEKNRNKYLRWAYGEAAILALKDGQIKKYHDRLKRKKHIVKAKAIIASKLARVSFMLMKDAKLTYDQNKLFV